MKITGTFHLQVQAHASWGLSFFADEVVKLGLVLDGSCYLNEASDRPPIALNSGDFFICTNGARYVLQDNLYSPTMDIAQVIACQQAPPLQSIKVGADGKPTTLLLGMLTLDAEIGTYLLSLLPTVMVLKKQDARTFTFSTYLELLVREMRDSAFGAESVANWLGGILFIHAIREFSLSQENCQPGWLYALKDKRIAKALAAIHKDVKRNWTVLQLAQEACMSRSGFALKFQELLGCSPINYLKGWRMALAASRLKEHKCSIMEIATQLGYESSTAFSKAFVSVHGISPGRYRDKVRTDNGSQSRPLTTQQRVP